MEESELIKRCKKGDRLAQEFLYSCYADKMFRVAYRYMKNQIEAEDVLIVALNKMFAAIDTFTTGEGSLEGWIRRIVVNESLMALRKRHNFNLTETLDVNTPEPDMQEMCDADAEEIFAAIEKLPTGYRTVFNLNVVEGYPHEDIAKMLGITVSTSRTQLFKAKALLKKMLSKEGSVYGT